MPKVLLVVVALLAAPLSARGQQSDAALTARAEAVLRQSPHVSIFDDVTVEVRNGVATLRGCVVVAAKRDDIGREFSRLGGLGALRNDLHVLPPSAEDARLRAAIAQAIYGHPSFWRHAAMARPPIHIIVSGGRVTLKGEVANDIERTLAFTLAHVAGVREVRNELLALARSGDRRQSP
jgi:osmotically-inducible protein OsmY